MHQPNTPWCTILLQQCAHFCYKWCIVGYLSNTLWDLWDHIMACIALKWTRYNRCDFFMSCWPDYKRGSCKTIFITHAAFLKTCFFYNQKPPLFLISFTPKTGLNCKRPILTVALWPTLTEAGEQQGWLMRGHLWVVSMRGTPVALWDHNIWFELI